MNGAAGGFKPYDVLVIGAGQAGLAIGHYLARQGEHFVILDGADSVGSAWRTRWDSLTLFTPRRYDALPEKPFPGDPDGYPTRDEVIDYLKSYAATFDLPVRLNSPVRSLTQEAGMYIADIEGTEVRAPQVVVATGPFQQPHVPAAAAGLANDVFQTHSTGYRKPDDLPQGTVLVVGGGNTGFQIADEISATHQTYLSVGSRQKPLPQTMLGRDLFWWLGKLRVLRVTADSKLGQRLKTRDVLIGSSPRKLARRGVGLRPRLVNASGRQARFADGSELEVDAVIWATGYKMNTDWIDLPIRDGDGNLRHRRGVTDIPGLYFLGLPWQNTRGSALLGWVKDDAAYIAHQISLKTPAESPVAHAV